MSLIISAQVIFLLILIITGQYKLYIIISAVMFILNNIYFLCFRNRTSAKNEKFSDYFNLNTFAKILTEDLNNIYNLKITGIEIFLKDNLFSYGEKSEKKSLINIGEEIIITIYGISDIVSKKISVDYLKNSIIPIAEIIESREKLSDLKRTVKLSNIQFISKMRILADKSDNGESGHTKRIGIMAKELARLSGLPEKTVFEIGIFSPLHDIGKITVPHNILHKPGRLDPGEFDLVKKHTISGAELLQGIEWMKTGWEIVLYHHEKFSGGGYPFGIRGSNIPVSARIVSVIDNYDSIRTKSTYKNSNSHLETIEKILKTQEYYRCFDPEIFDIFIENSHIFEKIYDLNS